MDSEGREGGKDLGERLTGLKLDADFGLDSQEKYTAAAAGVILLAVGIFAASGPEQSSQATGETVKLTQYQEQYVDCPVKYLETCTKMSKIPTEPVKYWKIQNDRLFLKLGDGRAIISTLPNSTSPGEFVTYMSAAEVEQAVQRNDGGQVTESNQTQGQPLNQTAEGNKTG